MAEKHGLQDLVAIGFDKIGIQHIGGWAGGVDVLFEIHGQEFEDQIEAVFLHNDILETDNVGMLELLEQRYLPDGSRRNTLGISNVTALIITAIK